MNIAACALCNRNPSNIALIWAEEGSPKSVSRISLEELRLQCLEVAGALQNQGYKPGKIKTLIDNWCTNFASVKQSCPVQFATISTSQVHTAPGLFLFPHNTFLRLPRHVILFRAFYMQHQKHKAQKCQIWILSIKTNSCASPKQWGL